MSKNYISPEHAIRNIMSGSNKNDVVKEQSLDLQEQESDSIMGIAKQNAEENIKKLQDAAKSAQNATQNAWQSAQDAYNDVMNSETLDKIIRGVTGNEDDYVQAIKDHISRSMRTNDLGTGNAPAGQPPNIQSQPAVPEIQGQAPQQKATVKQAKVEAPKKSKVVPDIKISYKGNWKNAPTSILASQVGGKGNKNNV